MNKKLLLAIQSACNSAGVRVPWDKVGEIMGEQISDGAVIQHLAKLRQRMIQQGQLVPPPLRRGGGNPISTAKNAGSAKVAAKKPSGGLSGLTLATNEDDEEIDVDKAADMDEEYGQPGTKHLKREKKTATAEKGSSKAKGQVVSKVEESDGSEGSIADQKAMKAAIAKKRKRVMKKTGHGKGKSLPKGKGLSPSKRVRRSSVDYAELSADYEGKREDDSGEDDEYVGAAAPYMKFAETPELEEDDQKKVNKPRVPPSKSATPSKIVVLQVGTAHLLEEAKRLEAGRAIESGASSESDEESEAGTEEEHVGTMQQLVNPELNLGHNDMFSAMYGDQGATAYQQYDNTAPGFGAFTPAANDPLTVAYPYDSLSVNNGNWYQGPGYTHSSFTGNAFPSPFGHPLASSTRLAIPPQVTGPNVETVPTSATSMYSDHRTPAVMGNNYYSALDDGMGGMNDFSQAYHNSTIPDPAFGQDDVFNYFNL